MRLFALRCLVYTYLLFGAVTGVAANHGSNGVKTVSIFLLVNWSAIRKKRCVTIANDGEMEKQSSG